MQFHFLEILPKTPTIDFVSKRRLFVVVSLIINAFVLAWSLPFIHGLNFGVDFAGGTEIQVRFAEKPDLNKVDAALEASGFGQESAQSFGPPEENSYIIRVGRIALMQPADAERAKTALGAAFATRKLIGVHFDPEVGDKIDLTFAQPVSTEELQKAVAGAGIKVSDVRELSLKEGKNDYPVITQGISDKVQKA